MIDTKCGWQCEGHPPCGRPGRRIDVLVVSGPRAGTVGWVYYCAEHEKQFYAARRDGQHLESAPRVHNAGTHIDRYDGFIDSAAPPDCLTSGLFSIRSLCHIRRSLKEKSSKLWMYENKTPGGPLSRAFHRI